MNFMAPVPSQFVFGKTEGRPRAPTLKIRQKADSFIKNIGQKTDPIL